VILKINAALAALLTFSGATAFASELGTLTGLPSENTPGIPAAQAVQNQGQAERQETEAPSAFDRPLRTKSDVLPARLLKSKNDRARGVKLPALAGFDRELTQSYITRYSSRGNLEWIASCLKNAGPYMAFIRDEVEKRELPAELIYLPLIESGYVINARSKSGARGMWQFMANSVHPYMKIDEWRDERLDFWKSTNGALSKLQTHYKEFGDWALALAAYNSGAGAVSRVIKDAKINDYWELADKKKLKSESIYYVPKLLAVYYIVSNPRKFNLDICLPEEDYSWTRIELNRQVNLALLAELAGVDSAALVKANSELSTLVTPPDNYHLKVREKDAPAIRNVLENSELKLIKHYIYTAKTGDTLSAIALHYGVNINAILSSNPGIRPNLLKPGDKIVIPALKDVAPYDGGLNKNPQSAAGHPANTGADMNITWTVRQGDTLWSIARYYNITPDALAGANNIAVNGTLSIGKVLKIP
jgi:membrane-bound lytic murein transglycosylase D